MPASKNLVGQKFGRLSVVRRSHSDIRGVWWVCICDCESQRAYTTASLKNGNSSSCGCYNKQRTSEAHTKHGHCAGYKSTKLYQAYKGMKRRCAPGGPKDYAGRGITVCDEWLGPDGFRCFAADMGDPPSSKHSLERKDNDGPYALWNCCWATKREQQRNRRVNVRLAMDGLELTVAEWSERCGINPATIHARLRYGWSTERALTERVHRARPSAR